MSLFDLAWILVVIDVGILLLVLAIYLKPKKEDSK